MAKLVSFKQDKILLDYTAPAANKNDPIMKIMQYLFEKGDNKAPFLIDNLRYAYGSRNMMIGITGLDRGAEWEVEDFNGSRVSAAAFWQGGGDNIGTPNFNDFDINNNITQFDLNKLVMVPIVQPLSEFLQGRYYEGMRMASLMPSIGLFKSGDLYYSHISLYPEMDFSDVYDTPVHYDNDYVYPKAVDYSGEDLTDWLVITGANFYYGSVPRIKTNYLPHILRVYECSGVNANSITYSDGSLVNIGVPFKYGFYSVDMYADIVRSYFTSLTGGNVGRSPRGFSFKAGFGMIFSAIDKYLMINSRAEEEGPNPLLKNGYLVGDKFINNDNICNFKLIGMFDRYSGDSSRYSVSRSDIYGTSVINFEGKSYGIPRESGRAIGVFKSFSDIASFFGNFGLFVSADPDSAITTPPADYPGYSPETPPGYDTNSAPTVPSNPDNNTDDFTDNVPTLSPLNLLSAYIYNFNSAQRLLTWFTKSEFYDNLSRLFNNPLSAIISLKMYPLDLVAHDKSHILSQNYTTIVNVTNDNISGYRITEGYNTIINGGEINYSAYYGNFSDWQNASYSVYIPFYGIVSVPPSAVINKYLSLKYAFDYLSGEATAILRTREQGTRGEGQLIGLYKCNISFDIPITYDNYNQKVINTSITALSGLSSLVSNASALGGNIALGAATGGANAGAIAQSAGALGGGLLNTGLNILEQNVKTPLEMGAKGTISPLSAISLPKSAYLLVSRKKLAVPSSGYGNLVGFPSAYFGTISSAAGGGNNYCKITAARLDFAATADEKSEINSLLSAGIYI